MKRNILIAAMVVLSLSLTLNHALAADWMYSEERFIESIFAQTTTFTFILEGALINPNGDCANRFSIDRSAEYYDEMLMTVMLAYSIGAQVKVYFDNAYTGCNVPIMRVRAY